PAGRGPSVLPGIPSFELVRRPAAGEPLGSKGGGGARSLAMSALPRAPRVRVPGPSGPGRSVRPRAAAGEGGGHDRREADEAGQQAQHLTQEQPVSLPGGGAMPPPPDASVMAWIDHHALRISGPTFAAAHAVDVVGDRKRAFHPGPRECGTGGAPPR